MAQLIVDRQLDVRGQLCPMPVVKTAREIKLMAPGQVLKVLATDRGAICDFPAWSADTGNPLLDWREEEGSLLFWFRKGSEGQA